MQQKAIKKINMTYQIINNKHLLRTTEDCIKVSIIGAQCYLLNMSEITLYTNTGRINTMLFYRDVVLLLITLKYE
jgi:hypothetical protein